jgi:hypothetical protein
MLASYGLEGTRSIHTNELHPRLQDGILSTLYNNNAAACSDLRDILYSQFNLSRMVLFEIDYASSI